MRHEFTVRPLTRTVQAPHSPTLQHSFAPQSRKVSRRRFNSMVFEPTLNE
jgi:hypothetical protein